MHFAYTPPQTTIEEMLGHRCVNLFGTIISGDDERFIEFLGRSEVPPRTDVYIDSAGGDVEAAINIGRVVRDNWLHTHVGQYLLDPSPAEHDDIFKPRSFQEGSCMSAATLLFLGGRLRFLSKGAKFGVHQFSFRDPSPMHIGRSQIMSSKIARYISDMGIPPEFLEISAATESTEIKLLDHDELRTISVVTDGETPVQWTVQSRNNTLYVRGERDSFFGHHKILLGFAKPQFYINAVVESQGRASQLTAFPLVELVVGMREQQVIDVSQRCERSETGMYTNLFLMISNAEAHEIAKSDGFGLRVRGGPDAGMFLGIAPMSTKGGEDLLESFVQTLS
ncbi:hypothetical protein NKI86_24130 [Mesorhizobium sp. M0320]|uniref:COG3904 family protein n=1 Tax=Mesorhizobium sp. M0320 TaxID=2956936 RepID=UPI0033352E06